MPSSFSYRRPGWGGTFKSELAYERDPDGQERRYQLVQRQLGDHPVTYRFEERDGQPVLVGIEVTTEGDAELTARTLREFAKTGDVYEYLRRHILKARQQEVAADFIGYEIADALEERRRDGRKGLPDKWYLPFVRRYVELIQAGDHRPIVTMADENRETVKYIEDVIRRARRRRLLTDPPRAGVAGGELTSKAQAIVRELQRLRAA